MESSRPKVEVAVDTLASALAAAEAGADRLELSADLELGGTTPTVGLLGAVKARLGLPAFVMIRPRAGDFVYTEADEEVMARDLDALLERGADGVVLGALTLGGLPDYDLVARLIQRVRPLPVTFHRAFDAIPSGPDTVEPLRAIGVDRILTAGGAPTASQGRGVIERLVRLAPKGLTIVAGGGINGANVREIVRRSGVGEVHLSGQHQVPSPARGGGMTTVPNPARVLRVVEAVRRLSEARAGRT